MSRVSLAALLAAVCVLTGCNRLAYRQPSLEGKWFALETQTVVAPRTYVEVDFTIEEATPPADGPETLGIQKAQRRSFTNLNLDEVPDGVAALMPENTAMVLLDIKKEQAIAIRFGNGDGDLVGGFAGTWTRQNPSQIDVDLGNGKKIRLHLLNRDQLLMADGSGKAITFTVGRPYHDWFWLFPLDPPSSANPSSASSPKNPEASPSG